MKKILEDEEVSVIIFQRNYLKWKEGPEKYLMKHQNIFVIYL